MKKEYFRVTFHQCHLGPTAGVAVRLMLGEAAGVGAGLEAPAAAAVGSTLMSLILSLAAVPVMVEMERVAV